MVSTFKTLVYIDRQCTYSNSVVLTTDSYEEVVSLLLPRLVPVNLETAVI